MLDAVMIGAEIGSDTGREGIRTGTDTGREGAGTGSDTGGEGFGMGSDTGGDTGREGTTARAGLPEALAGDARADPEVMADEACAELEDNGADAEVVSRR
jgi:hypothetical protein